MESLSELYPQDRVWILNLDLNVSLCVSVWGVMWTEVVSIKEVSSIVIPDEQRLIVG